jgi:hypothetical protein
MKRYINPLGHVFEYPSISACPIHDGFTVMYGLSFPVTNDHL